MNEFNARNIHDSDTTYPSKNREVRIVVLGTGFAGTTFIESFNKEIESVLRGKLRLIAVNQKNYQLFSPLLYEVATGQVYGYHVSLPVCCSVEDEGHEFLEAEVKAIIPESNEVLTSKGILHYDRLVVALGSESNDFGIEGVKEYAIPLKSLKDGEKIRNRILESYKGAISRMSGVDEITSLLSFVVIGGGATGVELSASILDFIDDLNKSHGGKKLKPRVILVELQEHLMKNLGTEFSDKLTRMLVDRGVELSLGKRVVKVTENGVVFSDGTLVGSKNVFLTAGIKNNPVLSSLENDSVKLERYRVRVDSHLRVPNSKNIYVIGDSCLPDGSDGNLNVPQTAAAAVQEGSYLGYSLANELNGRTSLTGFKYRDHGTFLSVGRFSGVCKLSNGLTLTGFPAWLLWRFIHLIRISTIRNRFEVLFDWTFSSFHNKIFIETE